MNMMDRRDHHNERAGLNWPCLLGYEHSLVYYKTNTEIISNIANALTPGNLVHYFDGT